MTRHTRVWLALTAGPVFALGLSLTTGPVRIAPAQVVRALTDPDPPVRSMARYLLERGSTIPVLP